MIADPTDDVDPLLRIFLCFFFLRCQRAKFVVHTETICIFGFKMVVPTVAQHVVGLIGTPQVQLFGAQLSFAQHF